MTQQKPSTDGIQEESLLSELRVTSTEALIAGVTKSEGVNGSTVEPVYYRRKMACYSITEGELQMMTFSNTLSAGFFAVGSFLLGIGIDFLKDPIAETDKIPEHVALINYYVQRGAIIGGVVSWLFGGVVLLWRSRQWNKIKKDQIV